MTPKRFDHTYQLGAIAVALAIGLVMVEWPVLFSYVLIVGFWLLIASIIGVIIYVVYWLVRNQLSPVTRVRAKVVRRRFKEWDVGLPTSTPAMAAAKLGLLGSNPQQAWEAYSRSAARSEAEDLNVAEGRNYFVTFLVNGHEIEFAVPEDSYGACAENAEGLLVYQGEAFRHFIPRISS